MSGLPDLDHDALIRQRMACAGVLDFVRDLTKDWEAFGQPGIFTTPNIIVTSIFARSTRTYEGVVKHLTGGGFGEQGVMLNRALFEDMVDARWASLNPDLAVERFAAHDRWTRHLADRVASDFPDYQTGDEPPPIELSEEEKREYAKLFGDWGQRSWTGVPMRRRLKEVEQQWTEGPIRRQFQYMYRRVQRINNEVLHLSSTSMGRLPTAPRENEDGQVQFRFGASGHMVHPALFGAFWAYSHTLLLLFDIFEPALSERYLKEYYRPIERELFPLTEEEVKGVGRNDPCPCGSGLKHKKCHGA